MINTPEIEYVDLSAEAEPVFAFSFPVSPERPAASEQLKAEIDYILELAATTDEFDYTTL